MKKISKEAYQNLFSSGRNPRSANLNLLVEKFYRRTCFFYEIELIEGISHADLPGFNLVLFGQVSPYTIKHLLKCLRCSA
ncbi:hypothetical protein [Anditalea andensis]|uniref:Uncharacterized protein n=1 Tax=Anditalea andensis TaxID=1048983 RepID=A0A074KQL6_9BACT|nr:hypothetical protein [Anditalea andensis]KEO72236.1 hypothetical protein EL17_18725 [Anditalea andensis]